MTRASHVPDRCSDSLGAWTDAVLVSSSGASGFLRQAPVTNASIAWIRLVG